MTEPMFPEAVRLGRSYPLPADLRLNAWAIVACVTAFVSRSVLSRHAEWDPVIRAAVALLPLVPSLLCVRSWARWITRLDEMQRQIQVGATLLATTGAVLVATAISLLGSAGVLRGTRLEHGLGWEGMFALVVGLFILGNLLANRRYR